MILKLRGSLLLLLLFFGIQVFGIENKVSFFGKDSLILDTIKYWKKGGCINLNLSQVSLSNWSTGGEKSIAVNSLLSFNANYARGLNAWDNSFDFGYGRLKKDGTQAVKTDDRFELMTKFGLKISKKWYYSGLVNIKTQIFPGYQYPENDSMKISDFLAPGTVFLSVGIDFKPSDKFSLLMSPVTGKTTIVASNQLSMKGAFGVDSGKYLRKELGGYLKLITKGCFLKIVNYQLKIDVFSNYMEKPGNIDWDSEFMLWAKLNRFISANFKTNIVYDDDAIIKPHRGPRLQIREFVGIGFSYKF
jgi:hypothetical protein